MTESFDAISYWERQRDSAETAMIISQKELHRLIGEVGLENVIFVDFTETNPPEEAA